jgi:hypothetical protein
MRRTFGAKGALVSTATLLSIVSLIGFALCLIFQWPSLFVLGHAADSKVTFADLVTGTVLSPPLAPWAILIVSTMLAASTRWWGTIAVIVLSALGVMFTIGGWGEAFGPANLSVPRSVLLVGGLVWMLLGLSLATLGVRELLARLRAGGRAPRTPTPPA